MAVSAADAAAAAGDGDGDGRDNIIVVGLAGWWSFVLAFAFVLLSLCCSLMC